MKYEDITPSMRMFIGNREGLRRIGFYADDLYCETARSGELGGALAIYCTLKTRDGKTFSIFCGPIDSEEATAAEYARVCAEQDSIPKKDRERIWEESEVRARSVDLIMTLMAKGITAPDPSEN